MTQTERGDILVPFWHKTVVTQRHLTWGDRRQAVAVFFSVCLEYSSESFPIAFFNLSETHEMGSQEEFTQELSFLYKLTWGGNPPWVFRIVV
ncbi:hypothetical protein [Bartonella sp. B1099]|uniref:hypothetical protein n=1 Tax=Bartonella sp. B1099 TaxID=2911422 RepID=UPI0020C320CF|nr:hypothetical protein [Bartonella sp. B1099]